MIGDPKFILLLVNPEERTLAIRCCEETERCAHRISRSKRRPELYSKILLRTIFTLRDDWMVDYSYSIDGEIFPSEGMMKFKIDNAVLASEVKGTGK